MPLINGKSDKSRNANIETELRAHPNMNPKQAAAIGYSVQRKAEHAGDTRRAYDANMRAVQECADSYKRK